MELSKKTDIICSSGKLYANATSPKRFIRKLVSGIADEVRSFNLMFGSCVDKNVAMNMEGTYWTCISDLDKMEYSEDIEIATL